MRTGRGVGLASAAGSATVKKILDFSGESVSMLCAGQNGSVTLIDRYNAWDVCKLFFTYKFACYCLLIDYHHTDDINVTILYRTSIQCNASYFLFYKSQDFFLPLQLSALSPVSCFRFLLYYHRSNRSGEEMSLSKGMVLCKGPPLPFKSFKFKATLLTMASLQPPIIPGSTYELFLHGEVVQCCITKLYSLNLTASGGGTEGKDLGSLKKSGRNIRSVGGNLTSSMGNKNRTENPKCIPGGRCAKVKIEVTQSVCIEPFKICDALGRFALRSKGKTCAVGICEKVKKIESLG